MKDANQSIKTYQEGYNAGLWGKPQLSCPHKDGSVGRKRWMKGYDRGVELTWFLRVKPKRNQVGLELKPYKPGGKYA